MASPTGTPASRELVRAPGERLGLRSARAAAGATQNSATRLRAEAVDGSVMSSGRGGGGAASGASLDQPPPRAASQAGLGRPPGCRAPGSRPTGRACRRSRAPPRRRARSPRGWRRSPRRGGRRTSTPWPSMPDTTEVATISRHSRCSRIRLAEPLRQRRGEVPLELGRQVRVLGQVRVEQLGEEHRSCCRPAARPAPAREPAVLALALGDLVVAGQRLQLTVEPGLSSQRMKRACTSTSRRLPPRGEPRLGLLVVVPEHERGHLVGHLNQ